MDPTRFDALARSLAAPKSRRSLLGSAAALAAGLLGGRAGEAQVTQAQCGNTVCAADLGVCADGCVCCVYGNGNSRCRPPGECSGTIVSPTTTTTTAAPTTTTAVPTTTPSPTTTTAAPITTTTTTTPPPAMTTTPPATTTTTTTAPGTCLAFNDSTCSNSQLDCCAGMICSYTDCDGNFKCLFDRGEGPCASSCDCASPTTTCSAGICCEGIGDGCDRDIECCGALVCQGSGGTCCVDSGNSCETDGQCCSGDCVAGECV